ncbi:anthrone oxygenase family protein [Streptomyces sp. NPDC006923]|uniref:anthrone oxygenase family protein n=1 Tax=Streptomyces sp. NPDC006923 TaxID=3155355 RepID=UPI0033C28EAA
MHTVPAAPGAPPVPPGRGDAAARPVLVAAAVGTGLMAGLYFAFDVSVMPGLARADDRTFVTVMRSVNEVIDNSALFGLLFVGVFLATGIAGALQRRLGHPDAARWTRAALALYGLSVVVTMCVNIPLNRALARPGSPPGSTGFGALRGGFERPWATANIVRTLACTAALGALGRALVLHGRGPAARP